MKKIFKFKLKDFSIEYTGKEIDLLDNIFSWVGDNIEKLSFVLNNNNVEDLTSGDDKNLYTGDPSLYINKNYSEAELKSTAAAINLKHGTNNAISAFCCLKDNYLSRNCGSNTTFTIDRFFIMMHFLGHTLFKKYFPHLNNEDSLLLVGNEETITLYFAAAMCRHYLNLDNFTSEMVKQIMYTTIDCKYLEEEMGEKLDTALQVNIIKALYIMTIRTMNTGLH